MVAVFKDEKTLTDVRVMEVSQLRPVLGENHAMDPLVVLGGRTFFVSDSNGDIDPSDAAASGIMHKDTRHLSRRHLLVNGAPTRALSNKVWRPGWARMFNLSHDSDDLEPEIAVVIDRMVVTDGIHEDVCVTNNGTVPVEVEVEFQFDTDFADLFEVRGMAAVERVVTKQVHSQGVEFSYSNDGFSRRTHISLSATGARLNGSGPTYTIELDPREEWKTCVHIACHMDQEEDSTSPCPFAPDYANEAPVRFVRIIEAAPTLTTDNEGLRHAYRQAVRDLAALHFPAIDGEDWLIPAAGLPWFMAVFGRDSLIAAYQSLPFMPDLARSTLQALAVLQAESTDEFRDAEPGKIVHEMRYGELSATGKIPFGPNYGSHDATLLYLILLDEYHRWTGDDELVRKLEAPARRAITWMEKYGDPDQDGFLEYHRHSTGGLINQGWKDSFDAIRFADGRIAEGPIATVEIQGYAFDARRRTARLAERVWGDPQLAKRLRADADTVRDRVEEEFWHADGYYAMALDGDKKQVDSVASNMGHLLWSGLASEERAETVVNRLMAEDMFSGWGIRTMSTTTAGFNPLSYHNGSVWPHDTSLIADGMRRYGFHDEARKLVIGLIEASSFFGYQLPELFAGYSRSELGFPVQYLSANRPQAWASGSVLLGLRTLLGIEVEGGAIKVDEGLNGSIGHLKIEGLYGPDGTRTDINPD